MEDDWDLHAVVRGCSAAAPSAVTAIATTATTAAFDFYSVSPNSNSTPFSNHLFPLQDPFAGPNSGEELHELFRPFFPKSQPAPPPPPPLLPSPAAALSAQKQRQLHTHLPKQLHASPVSAPRSKRRKNQLKKVCQVPAESLSSDIWAWRKYGQKPIKGSPYPRGYYRCSSSKGCMARKQVERNRSDPGMFIVTYTAEHNHPAPTHRNSLAGSTRQKPTSATPPAGSVDPAKPDPKQADCSSSSPEEEAAAAQSTVSESKEEKEELLAGDDEDDDDLGVSDMIVNDDFFVGFEELDSPRADDYFSDQFPANFGLPWSFNNAATAASGI